jgi:hypothetical protein
MVGPTQECGCERQAEGTILESFDQWRSGESAMTPDEEAELITPITNAARLQTLRRAFDRMRQRISAGSASIYTWLQARIAERQPRELIRHTGATLSTRLRKPLFWLRLIGPLCMFMAGMLRMAEPDTWLGNFFAYRFDAAKIGYRAMLQKQPLGPHDPGFQEILELALASDISGTHYVRDYMKKEQFGKIQTITYDGGQSGLVRFQGPSTPEHPFRTPLLGLKVKQGKGSIFALAIRKAISKNASLCLHSSGGQQLFWWQASASLYCCCCSPLLGRENHLQGKGRHEA